jgi:hypothetical protein
MIRPKGIMPAQAPRASSQSPAAETDPGCRTRLMDF